MQTARAIHRLVTVFIVLVTLYLAVTGTMIQLVDLRSIFTKAPASDPNVMAMREAFDGGGGYAVRAVKDYTAPALPASADFAAMLSRTMQSARLTVDNIPLRYVEFRMDDSKPVGIVESAGRLAEFDVATGQIIKVGPSARTDSEQPDSVRNTWKHWHRMTTFGNYALYINVVVGVGLSIMIATGLIIYFKMLSGRSRSTAAKPFWSGGGWWRTWHRRISIVAAVFLIVVSLSGLWLAYESLVFGSYMGSAKQRAQNQEFAAAQLKRIGPPPAPRPDPMSPEAQPKRLAAMQTDIGLTDAEMVKVKSITDDFVKKYVNLHQPGADPQEARTKTIAMHQQEASAVLAVLTDQEKPKFQAWRDAQLLGTPVPARGGRGGAGGPGQGGQQRQGGGGPQGQGGPQGAVGPQGQGGPQGPGGPQRQGGPQGPPQGAFAAQGPGGPGVPQGGGRPNGQAGGQARNGAPGGGGGAGGGGNDPASPLKDAELASMLKTTVDAEHAYAGDVPFKVVRLRVYAGMPQGVIVTGGNDNKQMVFNAQTGKAVSETEPGYPPVGFPFGWQAHQLAKDVHRGGIIGLTGRFMDLFAGLAMFYLSVSGIWIYIDLWKRRRRGGKSAPVWA